jgi:hypothetical protein
MGVEEDRLEFKGSNYERLLNDLKKGDLVHSFIVETSPGRWEAKPFRPPPGQGQYVERFPNGECGQFANRADGDGRYQRV